LTRVSTSPNRIRATTESRVSAKVLAGMVREWGPFFLSLIAFLAMLLYTTRLL